MLAQRWWRCWLTPPLAPCRARGGQEAAIQKQRADKKRNQERERERGTAGSKISDLFFVCPRRQQTPTTTHTPHPSISAISVFPCCFLSSSKAPTPFLRNEMHTNGFFHRRPFSHTLFFFPLREQRWSTSMDAGATTRAAASSLRLGGRAKR